MSNFLLTVRQIFQFRFWPHRCYCQCHVILGQLLRKYDVISIFQDGDRGRSILLPVSYFLMSLPSEGRNLSTNQISSTYINLWLRYNYFWFGKTNVFHIGIRFRSRPYPRNLHFILHQPVEFRPNRNSHYGNMTSYRFIKMAAVAFSYLLMSPPSECQNLSANQISSKYLNWRPRYNYFRFWKTNVRHIGILLRVSISTIWP